MQKLPPMSAVRVFEAAARHLNFTKAAEELGMTQAAVSYQIRILEERIGTPLFVRLPRRVSFTEAGRRLAPQITEAFEMLRIAFSSTAKLVDNVLSVAVLPTLAAHWLVPRLGQFHLAHPKIAVQLDVSQDFVDVERNRFDVGIRFGTGKWPGLESHLLLPCHFTPVCSPELLEGAKIESPADILSLPLLGAHDPWWVQWFEEAGVGRVDLSDRLNNSLGTQQFEGVAAMAGQGVALVNPFFFAADLAAGRVVQIFDLVAKAETSYFVVYSKARRRSPKIRAFCEWILTEAERDSAQAAFNQECRRAYRPFSIIDG